MKNTINADDDGDDDTLIITIGDTDYRISKHNELQVKVRKGVATVRLKKGDFSTTATTWVNLPSLSDDEKQKILSDVIHAKLKKLFPTFKENEGFLRKLSNKFPLKLEWLDVNVGIIKARFKPKTHDTSD